MSIKSLAEDDRPREKFLLKGKSSVSDSELLAIIMGSGNRDESAVELARRILISVENNWHRLSQLSIKDLTKFKGVGEAKAISIATALEIGSRRSQQEVLERQQISNSKDIFDILQPHLSDLPTKNFGQFSSIIKTKFYIKPAFSEVELPVLSQIFVLFLRPLSSIFQPRLLLLIIILQAV